MSDLFAARRAEARRAVEPLPVRMRPRTLDEFAGQRHILGEGKLLRRMIEADAITSILLHGPPGTGKTTLAEVIAGATRRHFVRENAASVGVKRIREIIDEAAQRIENSGPRTILFLDEIHRFTKAQQDVLLGDVERGLITLIGATTENPLFACNAALISRSTLFRLEPLEIDEIIGVVDRAIADTERGYGTLSLEVTDEAKRVWAVKSDGDARQALRALEVAVLSGGKRAPDDASEPPGPDNQQASPDTQQDQPPARAQTLRIDRAVAEDSIQRKAAVYDATGDQHYDTASALIKSIRGSDPDAALYWIAFMLEGGEDPRFIARRLAILASEDIGNADPRAIVIAQSSWDLIERIGLPEARITLAHVATYLALAPKSNAAYLAIDAAIEDVREGRTQPVPRILRDPNAAPEGIAHGDPRRQGKDKGYRYSHNADQRVIAGEAFGGVTDQDYLGVEKRYYHPTDNGAEKTLRQRLDEIIRLRERLAAGAPDTPDAPDAPDPPRAPEAPDQTP